MDRVPLADGEAEGRCLVHRILASVTDETERWAAIEDAPFNQRTGRRGWTPDAAKRLLGQRVERPVTVDEKVQAAADLTRDEEVAAIVTADLLRRPTATAQLAPAEGPAWSRS
ncbi:DUF6192 family protein [Streptomyces cyaneofuscatus]|uniref:DUF6192 family protein n=1 Tax=Streptomyces cyaneofuscatus TaxID=66883 RepID=UPI0036ADE56D